MRKRTGLVASGAMLAATAGLFGTAASASASTTSASTASPVVGYTYLDGNTAVSNTIDAFARHADGSVSPVGSGTFAAGGAGLGDISAYHDNFLGQLSPIGNSPFADNQTAPCWVEISHDGRFLFTVNTGSGSISSYAINPDGSLTLLGSTTIRGGGADIDARLTPNGQQLLVDGSGHHILSVFDVNGGQLTEAPTSPTPLPAGGSPAGIVNI